MPLSSSTELQIVRRQAAPEALAALEASASLSPLERRVFAQRGVADLGELDLSLGGLLSVEAFPACAEAAALLESVMRDDGKILLIGDHDADGATGVAVAMRSLQAMGYPHAAYLVSNRFAHSGRGICLELMDDILQQAPALIVTIDHGIANREAIAQAREHGIRVLVTDHHEPPLDGVPPADCIVHPDCPAGSFASRPAGVGVIFYVMLALRRRLAESGWFAQQDREPPRMAAFLDLVAVGTIADLVPLDRNNRILVEQGLQCIRTGQGAPGIVSLLRCAKRDPRRAGSADLAFAAAPRINAAGRMDDISAGIQCLLAEGRMAAHERAVELDRINAQRRHRGEAMQKEALREADRMEPEATGALALCLYRPEWHEGLSGIIAARLKEQYGLPAIVFANSREPGMLKGSGRSVPNLNLRNVLDRVQQADGALMQGRFGGHPMAVGLHLAEAGLERFRELFEAAVSQALDGRRPGRVLETDGVLEAAEFTCENAEFASIGHPWGKDFEPPLFEGEFEVQEYSVFKNAHVRFHLNPVGHPECRLKAMAFSHDRFDWEPEHKRLKLVFELQVDEFHGHRACMLNIRHMEPL